MKLKKTRDSYARLKTKMMVQVLGALAAALGVLILLYILLWAGRGADFTVLTLQTLFGVSYDEALNLYDNHIRGNAELILFCACVVLFIAFLWFFSSRFTRYFGEVNRGIDGLLKDDGGDIRLVPELDAVEDKLNTVRRELAARTRESQLAEQRKNNLVMYLAHDIRTPLTSVIGYLSLLDEVPNMPGAQRERYTRITLDKALRLEKLVDEFFDITRYNLQYIRLERENVDLYYLLSQLAEEFYPILSARGNSARLDAPESLRVYGDPVELARVFNNLLKNAAAYSDAGSEIWIRAGVLEGGWVCVIFQNTGPTIPPEKLSAIFDKFYRLDASRASNTGGAGLGLSIAQEIVAAHGGQLSASSEAGVTAFTVFLPPKPDTTLPPGNLNPSLGKS